MTDRTVFRTCPLCEATCGLEITVRDDKVQRIRGDRDDVFSHGFICPKGSTLKQLHDDPDRLRRPVVRRGFDDSGAPIFEEVSWAKAWQRVAELLTQVRTAHGDDAVGVYLGNPNAHLLGSSTHGRFLLRSFGGRSRFSASTVDQMPRHVASGHLYGGPMSIPVPDLDRTDLLVIAGANPYASNGSVCTAPGFPDRIEALQARGGRVVVIDPRRSRTASTADQHLAVRPGTDAVLFAAVAHHLLEAGLVEPGHLADLVAGLDDLAPLLAPFTPDRVAAVTGVAADDIRALAEDLAAAESAAVYGRIGTTTVGFGTLASWLIDVLAILTGNLDRPGGSMFSRPATERVRPAPEPGSGRTYTTGRYTSRVNDRPEVQGEFPAAEMPDEILTPGDGQIRMMLTLAGNPVLSCPDGDRMDEAFASLDAMVAVDIYVNETTRHADVILPPPGSLEKPHYDLALYSFAIRNVANWSDAVFSRDPEQPSEEDIFAKLTLIATGAGSDADPAAFHAELLAGLLAGEVGAEGSPVFGRDVDELLEMVEGADGSDRLFDAMIRTGPYGDGFGADPDGLSLAALRANPHGVDKGALEPRLPGILRTASGKIELFAGPFATELERLAAAMDEWATDDRLRLVGRRHLRSNNSWMHNLEVLVKGKARCTLQVHPDDAVRLGLADGGSATVRSRVGEVVAPVEITDTVMAGVVSLPHGWGHSLPGVRMDVASRHAGVNSNVLTDPAEMDPLSGNAVLNGIPVDVVPA